jgi:hypothetical protein
MMAQAMHLLPFLMSEARTHPKEAERMVFHMQKIVSYPQNWKDGQSTNESHKKRLEVPSHQERYDKQGDKCDSIYLRFGNVLKLFGLIQL